MDFERVQAEVEAKVAAEQQNEDVLLRKIRAQVEKNAPNIRRRRAQSLYLCTTNGGKQSRDKQNSANEGHGCLS